MFRIRFENFCQVSFQMAKLFQMKMRKREWMQSDEQ
jgi:hypothetical protein